MHDQPTPAEILESVAALLRDTLAARLPPREAFDARVAANAIDLVRRELAPATRTTAEEARMQLAQLLGREGTFEELNRVLCERIASGELGLSHPTLMKHLWTTTLAKVAVDQPTYASYKKEMSSD